MAKPRKPTAKSRRDVDASVSVEFDYDEASLLVVAANVLFGAMPDREAQRSLEGLLGKLYKAEPRLKSDARRIESEMRSVLAPGGLDETDDGDVDDEFQPLAGAQYLELVAIAMDEGRPVSLLRKDGVIALMPTGMGQIGTVAVAIGWSAAHEDYAIVRLDEVLGAGPQDPSVRPPASDPVEATLERLCRKPPVRGSLI
ncbi:MAG: hypothetical protein AB7O88_18440 [Reyranellaceae bacterium]